MDRATQYAKITAEEFDPYAEIRALVGDLVKACESWELLADEADEKPMIANNPVEWEMSATGVFHITHHIPSLQHTYVNVHSNGDIHIALSLPAEGDNHELSLRKDRDPSYSHDPSQISIGFPVVRFISWLQLAIDACTMM